MSRNSGIATIIVVTSPSRRGFLVRLTAMRAATGNTSASAEETAGRDSAAVQAQTMGERQGRAVRCCWDFNANNRTTATLKLRHR